MAGPESGAPNGGADAHLVISQGELTRLIKALCDATGMTPTSLYHALGSTLKMNTNGTNDSAAPGELADGGGDATPAHGQPPEVPLQPLPAPAGGNAPTALPAAWPLNSQQHHSHQNEHSHQQSHAVAAAAAAAYEPQQQQQTYGLQGEAQYQQGAGTHRPMESPVPAGGQAGSGMPPGQRAFLDSLSPLSSSAVEAFQEARQSRGDSHTPKGHQLSSSTLEAFHTAAQSRMDRNAPNPKGGPGLLTPPPFPLSAFAPQLLPQHDGDARSAAAAAAAAAAPPSAPGRLGLGVSGGAPASSPQGSHAGGGPHSNAAPGSAPLPSRKGLGIKFLDIPSEDGASAEASAGAGPFSSGQLQGSFLGTGPAALPSAALPPDAPGLPWKKEQAQHLQLLRVADEESAAAWGADGSPVLRLGMPGSGPSLGSGAWGQHLEPLGKDKGLAAEGVRAWDSRLPEPHGRRESKRARETREAREADQQGTQHSLPPPVGGRVAPALHLQANAPMDDKPGAAEAPGYAPAPSGRRGRRGGKRALDEAAVAEEAEGGALGAGGLGPCGRAEGGLSGKAEGEGSLSGKSELETLWKAMHHSGFALAPPEPGAAGAAHKSQERDEREDEEEDEEGGHSDAAPGAPLVRKAFAAVLAAKEQSKKQSTGQQAIAARRRRERVNARLRALQGLVPGAASMTTESFLLEAVHYIRFLMDQLQELAGSAGEAEDAAGASSRSDGDAMLASRELRERRGLCVTSVAQLMPLVGFGGFLDQFLVKQQEAGGAQGQKEHPGQDEEAKGGVEHSESDGYEEDASE